MPLLFDCSAPKMRVTKPLLYHLQDKILYEFSKWISKEFLGISYVAWTLAWICCKSLMHGNLESLDELLNALNMPLWLYEFCLHHELIVLCIVSPHPWLGLAFIYWLNVALIFVYGIRCVYLETDVSTSAVSFHMLLWYYIPLGMTRALYCIFIFVLFTLTMLRNGKLTKEANC